MAKIDPLYEIEFMIHDLGGRYTTYVDSIADIKDGFWVTKEGSFTKGSDCYAYIMPHMVKYVLKTDISI